MTGPAIKKQAPSSAKRGVAAGLLLAGCLLAGAGDGFAQGAAAAAIIAPSPPVVALPAIPTVATPVPADATAPAPRPVAAPAARREPPSPQAVGGLNCLLFGSAAAAGVYIYNDILMVAVTGYVNPALLVPSMAGAFVAGCGVGNILTPGLLYLRSWLF
jgi:hypothetical protein